MQGKGGVENVLIGLSLLGGAALLLGAWSLGDASESARTLQWQLMFLGLGLVLAGKWIVGGAPAVKKQQIAAASAIFALAGVGLQVHYRLSWAPSSPFIVGYVFLFLAAEAFVFLGREWATARRSLQYLRFGVVAWNLVWGAYYLSTSYVQLPDTLNLYIAFSWLWTAATAIIGWSEMSEINEIAPARNTAAPSPTPAEPFDFSSFSGGV